MSWAGQRRINLLASARLGSTRLDQEALHDTHRPLALASHYLSAFSLDMQIHHCNLQVIIARLRHYQATMDVFQSIRNTHVVVLFGSLASKAAWLRTSM